MSLVLIFFFISGAIGLIAEVVWTRMLLNIFGTTTYSVVTVLSTFMAGLALGSAVLGKISDKRKDPVKFYGVLEIAVGVCSLLTLIFIPLTQQIYRYVFHLFPGPILILLVKLIFSSLSILPATFFMGGTLPTLIQAFTAMKKELTKQTALLYAVNTFGAAAGTLFAGFFSIELLGLSKTLMLASFGNLVIGGIISTLPKLVKEGKKEQKIIEFRQRGKIRYSRQQLNIAVFSFGISGFISMAYEVVWTRLLTPSVGTYIYAFSIILALFLVGIALGSNLSKFFLQRTKRFLALFGLIEAGIGVFAFLTVVVTSQFFSLSTVLKVVFVTLPATVLSGATFPVVISLFSVKEKVGGLIGATYAVNTIGSIIGPIIAGFLLLPFLGTTKTILLLALFNLLISFILMLSEKNWRGKFPAISLISTLAVGIMVIARFFPQFFYEKSLADYLKKFKKEHYAYLYTEDETAAVLAYAAPKNREAAVLVDGISQTGLVEETKFMAHLPLLLIPKPEKALVICFGMGTTFRSALSHQIEVHGVELIPSVPKAFPLFYKDAAEILANPKAKIIVNDGRNYVFLTKERYDLITVDPPPPINSAQTTVLYSKEFYQQAKKVLTKDGIFTQWIYLHGARSDDIGMFIKSFTEVFPFVSVYKGPRELGIYLLGSEKEIKIDKNLMAQKYQEEKIFKDINEWRSDPYTLDQILDLYVGDKETLSKLTNGLPPVTDDRPVTEYFLLRRMLSPKPIIQFAKDVLR